ncbi:hypothetical protein MVEN_01592400 [Mycena venus]|uniref:Secreted protein n=1 Tax=Mycena venus TaxID=2733690 RepID=A0A8H6XPS2_9AGAR|nr:hypothetical protein MVEN_01592400 [Mycena venus]
MYITTSISLIFWFVFCSLAPLSEEQLQILISINSLIFSSFPKVPLEFHCLSSHVRTTFYLLRWSAVNVYKSNLFRSRSKPDAAVGDSGDSCSEVVQDAVGQCFAGCA